MPPPVAGQGIFWGQRTCAPPPCGGDVHAPAPSPAKRARNPIDVRLLQRFQALGPDGIQSAGGLSELAREHGVSFRGLTNLIRENGTLTAQGQAKIRRDVHGLATKPITARLLQQLSALGPGGIQDAGGVAALALLHGVSVNSLQSLILETGCLTAKGQDKIKTQVLDLPHQPVTARLLQELSALGPDGIQGAGGVSALALKHDVSVNNLQSHIGESGRLTVSGQDKINSEVLGLPRQPITASLLQELSALGADGIKDAGGVRAWALRRGVSGNALHLLIRETGQLTALGQDKVNREVHGLATKPITAQLLQ
jgi:hypothetical protein